MRYFIFFYVATLPFDRINGETAIAVPRGTFPKREETVKNIAKHHGIMCENIIFTSVFEFLSEDDYLDWTHRETEN